MTQNKSKIYESPSITADTVIFTIEDETLKVLLINRANPPFAGWRALPGVYLLKNETADRATLRALKSKAGVSTSYLEQLYTFDSLFRDPRGHVVSIAYFALVPVEHITLDTKNPNSPELFPVNRLPKLAFDHSSIIKYAKRRLRSKLEYTNAAYSLLPFEFTLTQLQKTYEIILGKKQDKRNFRKKFLSMGLIHRTKKKLIGVRQRPAELYRFTSRTPHELKKFF